MKRQLFTRLAILLLLSISIVALAQKPAGFWTGKVDFGDVKPKSRQEQAQVDQYKKMIGSAAMTLTVKADKTYQLVFPAPGGQKGLTENGKWSQTGTSIALVPTKGMTSTGTISSNGKKLTLFPPKGDSGPKGLKVVFTRK